MRPAPGHRGELEIRRAARLRSPAELLPASGGRPALAGSALLRLQREHGNRHVQRLVTAMIQRRPADGPPDRLPGGPVGDRYERAAEHGADLVAGGQAASGIEPVHGAAPAADRRVLGEIGRARGGGKPLPADLRRSMEQAYGTDFSAVRTHSDARADRFARSLDALAFTTGQDIFFRRGAYAPASSAGKRLLAHELAHSIQQGDGSDRIQRYLFTGLAGRYKSLEAFQADLGGRVSGPLDELRLSLVDYEKRIPRNQLGPTNNNLLSSDQAGLVRQLLIRVLESVDRVLLSGDEGLTEKEITAADRLRVGVQDELKNLVARMAALPGGQQAEPSSTGQRYLADQRQFADWLAQQPIYRKWAWRGAGTCEQASKEISEWLTASLFNDDQERVKVRGIMAIAPPQVGSAGMSYVNHFVTVVRLPSAGAVVIDPTMSQFLGCGRPMIDDESTWADRMRGSKANFGDQRYRRPSDIQWKDCTNAAAALVYAPNPLKVASDFKRETEKQKRALKPQGPPLGGLSREMLVALSAFVVIAAILGFVVIKYALS